MCLSPPAAKARQDKAAAGLAAPHAVSKPPMTTPHRCMVGTAHTYGVLHLVLIPDISNQQSWMQFPAASSASNNESTPDTRSALAAEHGCVIVDAWQRLQMHAIMEQIALSCHASHNVVLHTKHAVSQPQWLTELPVAPDMLLEVCTHSD